MEQHLKLFSKACRLSESLGSTKIHWNKLTSRLSVNTGHNKIFQIKLKAYLLFLLVFISAGLYEFIIVKSKASSLFNQILFALATQTLITLFFLILSFEKHKTTVCFYVNGLFELIRKLSSKTCYKTKSGSSIVTNVNIGFAYMCYLYAIMFPIFFVYCLHWMDPCKPSLNGYFILAACKNPGKNSHDPLKMVDFGLKLTLLLGNYCVWSFAVNIAAIVIPAVQILSTISFKNCIEW